MPPSTPSVETNHRRPMGRHVVGGCAGWPRLDERAPLREGERQEHLHGRHGDDLPQNGHAPAGGNAPQRMSSSGTLATRATFSAVAADGRPRADTAATTVACVVRIALASALPLPSFRLRKIMAALTKRRSSDVRAGDRSGS
jgi:hypothetical protein